MLTVTLYVLFILLFLKIFAKLTTSVCTSKKCLLGKTAIITGGNSGMGFETALDLASRGCKVIIGDIINAEESVAKIKKESGNENIYYKYLDLGSLESVRQFSNEIKESEKHLDILINNAGTGGFGNEYTEDGLLKLMHINYFGHFLLVHLLVDLLKKGKNSRIVFVSSINAYVHNVRSAVDINKVPKSNRLLTALYQYGNSKLCMIMASDILSKKLAKYNIACNAVYPGLVFTNIFYQTYENAKNLTGMLLFKYGTLVILVLFGKTSLEGAQTILHCALADNVGSGHFYIECYKFIKPAVAKNKELAKIIWETSENLVKLNEEEKI